jgi:hypothetical protein
MHRVVFALVAFSLIGASCHDAPKRETAALVNAVDFFRRADGAGRADRVRDVAGVPCTEARVCEAKGICLAAIEPTARALALKDEVAARVADLEQKRLPPDAPEVRDLPAKLDEAKRLLEAGRAKMGECEVKLADLRVTFGG